MVEYWRYCRAFVASRRDERADDICSELLDAHEADPDPDNGTGISYHEVESVVYGISFAGHDPVTALLCNTLRCLLPRRDQWDALVADPALAANAVEETLRYESSQVAWRRIATRDTSIGGIEVPPGPGSSSTSPPPTTSPTCSPIRRCSTSTASAPATTSASAKASTTASVPGWRGSRRASSSRSSLSACRQLRLVDGQQLTFFPNITFRGPDELLVEWD